MFHKKGSKRIKYSVPVILRLLLITLLLSTTACTKHREYDTVLNTADTLLSVRPDSVIQLLEPLASKQEKMEKSQKMRWQLLLLMAQNKCDTVFHSDSIQEELVKYYDSHGTPNERMLAHYLLGRAYSDMGEAPKALKSFQRATECADTLSEDCDFYNLCSIYGQMALLFNTHHMPVEELEAWEKYSHFSFRDGDTYNYILGKQLQILPYYEMDDTANCFKLTEEVHQLFKDNNMPDKAARVYPTAILVLLQHEQYQRARRLMDIFEKESGLFDEYGEISPGKEHYYNSKGMYYMGIHLPDSAEWYFRKLALSQYNRNYEAYSGLLSVYQSRGNVDSVMKYALLCKNALDSIHADEQTDAVATANALYNFNRMEQIAHLNIIKAERMKLWVWTIVFVFLFLSFAGIWGLHLYKKKKQIQLSQLKDSYMVAVRRYEEIKSDLEMLENDRSDIINNKKEEIEKLSHEIDQYRKQLNILSCQDRDVELLNTDTIADFREKAIGKRDTTPPTSDDWILLEELVRQYMPTFHARIISGKKLSNQERIVCIFTRLGFSNGDIAVLLNTSPQRVTNVKSSSNKKLFGNSNAGNLETNLLYL